jgi:hypothetical protein
VLNLDTSGDTVMVNVRLVCVLCVDFIGKYLVPGTWYKYSKVPVSLRSSSRVAKYTLRKIIRIAGTEARKACLEAHSREMPHCVNQ